MNDKYFKKKRKNAMTKKKGKRILHGITLIYVSTEKGKKEILLKEIDTEDCAVPIGGYIPARRSYISINNASTTL